jgi:hypothetical protein
MTSTQNATVETLPVTNLRASRKQQTAAKAPAKKTPPAKPVAEKTVEPAAKVKYEATARSGRANSRMSAVPLVAAVDVQIQESKNAQYVAGGIIRFYPSVEKAQKAADGINTAPPTWDIGTPTNAVVVEVKPA